MSDQQKRCEPFLPRPPIRRATVLALCLALLGAGSVISALPATAQEAGGPIIEVAAEIRVPSAVVTPLRIKVSRRGGVSNQAMLLVRGVPPRVTLLEGRSFSPGVWTVPLTNLGKLEIAPATGTAGSSEITLELVNLDGKVLAGARSSLIIMPPAAPAEARGASPNDTVALTAGPLPGNPQIAGPVTTLTREEVERVAILVERGDESIRSGKITAARLFYKSAAESGWAPAALALAATYDSNELPRLNVIGGIQPDAALARKWYAKAKELGSPDADRYLQRLGTR